MKTIVLDIETIPDTEAMQRIGYEPGEGFPAWPLHALACVSLLTVERQGGEGLGFRIETFSRVDMGERGIVAEVERELETAQEVITFNGRGFDVPVLLARAALTGERTPSIARLYARNRPGYHADLLDEVTANRSAPRVTLAQLCAAFAIPVKLEAAGDGVAELAAAGGWDRIARYCETDVVATWLAAQMWRLADEPGFAQERWAALGAWIAGEQPGLAHLLPYAHVPKLGGGRRLGPDTLDSIFF